MSDDRAVSNVIGFVLAFSMILLGSGLVYTVGLSALTEVQTAEQVNNAERAFVALSGSVGDLQRGDAPVRSGEVRLGGGTLRVADAGTVTVSVEGGGPPPNTYETDPGRLVYRLGDESISYTLGGVVRTSGEASVLREPPPIVCAGDRAVVSLVTVEAANGTPAVSGSGSVLVVAAHRSTDLREARSADTGEVDVTLTVERHPDAWGRHLTANGWVRESDDTFRCSAGTVYVREVAIETSLLR